MQKFQPSNILVYTPKVMAHWYSPSRPSYHERSWVQTTIVLVNGLGFTLSVSIEHNMRYCKFILCCVK
jgi:hypothetical protein